MLCGLGGWPAQAHPHVWITAETTVLHENGTFTGLKHRWTFDEFYSAMEVEGLDKNSDGKFDREELAELANFYVSGLKEFSYFTFPALAGHKLALGEPKDIWLEHKDNVLSLHFTLPFATAGADGRQGPGVLGVRSELVHRPRHRQAEQHAACGRNAPVLQDRDRRSRQGSVQRRRAQRGLRGPVRRHGDGLGEGGVGDLRNLMTILRALRILALVVAALVLPALVLPATAQAQQTEPRKSPFGAEKSLAQPRAAEPGSSPGVLQQAGSWLLEKQAQLNRELATAVRRIKGADPFSATLTLAFLSFAYGVLHAAGPGHGKAVISSYVLADGRTVRRGILLAFLAAMIQALSALVLVAVLVLVLRSTGMQMRLMEAWLETISWGLVTLVGAWLVYYQLRGAFAGSVGAWA